MTTITWSQAPGVVLSSSARDRCCSGWILGWVDFGLGEFWVVWILAWVDFGFFFVISGGFCPRTVESTIIMGAGLVALIRDILIINNHK